MPFPPPAVNGVSCGQQSAQPTFEVFWDLTGYPQGQQFVIGIFDMSLTNPITVSAPVSGSTGSVTATQNMLQANSYQVRVTTFDSGTPGPWPTSGPQALFISPTNLNVTFDGTTIGAQWQNPAAGTVPLGGRVTIEINSYQYVFDLSGAAGTFVPEGVPLDPAQPATLTVSGLYGVSLGPTSAAVTLIQNAYPLTLVDNDGANPRAVAVQGAVSGSPRGFNVLLSSDGTPLQWFDGVQEDSSGRLSLTFNAEPVPGVMYDLSARLATANSTGPLGPSAPLVVAPPVAPSVAYEANANNGRLTFEATLPPGPPFVSGVQLTLTESGVAAPVVQQVVAGGSGTLQIAKLGGDNYTALFRSARGIPAGVSLGPAAASAPAVLTLAPSVTAINYDGSVLEAEYTALSQGGVTAYQLEVLSGAGTIASAQFGGTKGWLPLRGGAGIPYSVRVRAVGDATVGTAGTPADAVIAPVVITSATTDAITGLTTLHWTAAANATSYSLQLFADGLPTGPTTPGLTGTSYTLPSALAVSTRLSAALAAVVVSPPTTATGQFGTPYALPTVQPSNVSVEYNGASLTLSWTPIPGATGYTASVYAGGATQPTATADAPANASGVTFPPFNADPNAVFNVVVQARVNGDTGPPTTAVPLFTPAFFVGSDQTQAPSIRPSGSLAFANENITLYLPDLGAGTPLQNLPVTRGAFTLAANADSATKASYPYTLSIPSTSEAWTFDANTLRTQLQDDYKAFLTAAETSGVVPWGISVLQQAISRTMPQTFQETLYYAYGLDLPNSCADIRPGMVLRVTMSDYVNVGQTATSPWLNGYAGGPAGVDYDISSYLSPSLAPARQWTVGFDALLAQLAASGAINVQPPQSSPANQTAAGVAEAVDLFYGSFRQPFYRLFFPQDVMTPTGIGSAFTPLSFVLAAAPSYASLAATVNYPTATNAVAYFRGRVVVKLCVRVLVNGSEQTVPLGTTVGNILERYAQQIPSAPVPFGGLRLQRSLGLAVTQPSAPVAAGSSWRVRLDWNHLTVYGPSRDALSLPLLHGDQLMIGCGTR